VSSQGFPTWGVGTPWGCQTQIQGVSGSFPRSNTKIRNLVPRNVYRTLNFDGRVSNQLRLTE